MIEVSYHSIPSVPQVRHLNLDVSLQLANSRLTLKAPKTLFGDLPENVSVEAGDIESEVIIAATAATGPFSFYNWQ